jgi:hypothetical protein
MQEDMLQGYGDVPLVCEKRRQAQGKCLRFLTMYVYKQGLWINLKPF